MSKVKFRKYNLKHSLNIKTLPYGDEGEADVKLYENYPLH